MQLFQLQLVIGDQLDLALLALDRAFAALEVEAGRDLAIDAGEGIVNLGDLDPGNNIEARHGKVLSTTLIMTCAI